MALAEGDAPPRDAPAVDGALFVVLVNAQAQHSLWPAGAELPAGWTRIAAAASRADCLRIVEVLWPDLRPVSLRGSMTEGPR